LQYKKTYVRHNNKTSYKLQSKRKKKKSGNKGELRGTKGNIGEQRVTQGNAARVTQSNTGEHRGTKGNTE